MDAGPGPSRPDLKMKFIKVSESSWASCFVTDTDRSSVPSDGSSRRKLPSPNKWHLDTDEHGRVYRYAFRDFDPDNAHDIVNEVPSRFLGFKEKYTKRLELKISKYKALIESLIKEGCERSQDM